MAKQDHRRKKEPASYMQSTHVKLEYTHSQAEKTTTVVDEDKI
jgi:hypothetical protein